MAGGTQPTDVTSAGTSLNPPVFKTQVAPGFPQPTPPTTDNVRLFFDVNRYTTGTSTATNAEGSIRSFDFIKSQLVGAMTQLGG